MKGRANDKIRTELRGGWPKLIGRAFSTIVDSLFLLFLPSIHIARDIYGASLSFSRNISKAMTRGYLFFSSLVERPWRERRIALFFYFIFFLQGETSLFFRGRDFSRSTVAQFSKIRRDSLLPGMRAILRYRVITRARGSTFAREKRCTLSFFGGFLLDLGMDRRWNFEIEICIVLY